MDKLHQPYTQSFEQLCRLLESTPMGLSVGEIPARLKEGGPNVLPERRSPTLVEIFFRQFLSPLIYVLLLASLLSWYLGHTTDALFIFVVLLLNAVIGTFQEYQAEKSARALRQLTAPRALVVRDGENYEIHSKELVPGDVVLLETDRKVPADVRLFQSKGLEVDESTLTGESQPVVKDADKHLKKETPVADRINMAFSGSLVTRGQGRGLVVATGLDTQLGQIASHISQTEDTKTPLMLRTEAFTKKLSLYLGLVIVALGGLFYLQGQSWHDTLLLAVALAVDAIPEGLPVALTVALAKASRIMAKKNVVARKLSAVEALGSCTAIATDKTGTLTVNEQTLKAIFLPNSSQPIPVSGAGLNPSGEVKTTSLEAYQVNSLAQCGVLCSEANLRKSNEHWSARGDSVDVAFVVLAHKLGFSDSELAHLYIQRDQIPYESQNAYAATLHQHNQQRIISVKGSLDKILPMCSEMLCGKEPEIIDHSGVKRQERILAESGYRVLAVARKWDPHDVDTSLEPQHLHDMEFLGLVGLTDPLRPGTDQAITHCKHAGIDVIMITGDHPITALAIAKELGLAHSEDEVVTGRHMDKMTHGEDFNHCLKRAKVFARVTPKHKLQVVEGLKKMNHFVAVTGDGANDAPALKAAHVGVAMGRRGTDVAKETSDLIIADDRFSTIVDGVFHGRVAYNNVRKVVYLLLSTGAAEIVLFALAVLSGLPMPLTAIQVLWVNLVTNGIQDVALAFEPPEGRELQQAPRSPQQPLVDRILMYKILLSAVVIGGMTYFAYRFMLENNATYPAANNTALLLMVLFGNVMIGNCRSETKSAFTISLFSNPLLLIAAVAAQGIHIWAMHSDWLGPVLGASPVSLTHWIWCLITALSVLLAIEIQKQWALRVKG